ncbi:glycosyl transferase [Leucobacter viscericola]|uniref:Glycosyl transferase n=1 Tax=Leucobacter viscericola TaxID=2714935 RepID=A0A6G7XBP1_9MICO|nr:glycosyl transferase [Leucobacter viscericola]QIK61886.1 glycosyl transferase [Leucobacter viscericola]
MNERPIDVVAPPMAGHLHPILGIGVAIAERSRRPVRVISTEAARASIEAAGLTAVTVLHGQDAAVERIANPSQRVRGNPRRLLAQLRENLALMAGFSTDIKALYAQEPPELALVDFTVPVAGFAAREVGARWWTSLPSPCVLETRVGPPSYLGGLTPATNHFTSVGQATLRASVRTFKRAAVRLNRKTLAPLGITRPFRPDGSEVIYSDERIWALGLEELEFERSWPDSLRWAGPVLYTPPQATPPPSTPLPGPTTEPLTSLSGHEQRVLITFGTQLPDYKRQVLAAVIELAKLEPHTGFVFSEGSNGTVLSPVKPLPPNLVVVPTVSYRDLSRYDLVVHHGGAGVMYSALEAAVPTIVHPVDYDQFDSAARLSFHGLAERVDKLSHLPAAVQRALNSQAMQRGHAQRRRFAELVTATSGAATVAEAVVAETG